MRQGVLSAPKRLRYFLARDGKFLNRTIAHAIHCIEQCLRVRTPLADPTARSIVEPDAAREMLAWAHSDGLSLDASVVIPGLDDPLARAGEFTAGFCLPSNVHPHYVHWPPEHVPTAPGLGYEVGWDMIEDSALTEFK